MPDITKQRLSGGPAALAAEEPRGALAALIVDDSNDDAELAASALEEAGYAPVRWRRVEDAVGMQTALAKESWDVVLCDHLMPAFDSFEALAVLGASGFALPLILVSGAVGEETAVAAIRAGAADFVSKDRLYRLAVVVRGCLRQVEERRAREAAEQAERDSQERFRVAVETTLDGLANFSSIRDRSGRITDFRYEYVNQALCARSGMDPSQLIGNRLLELFPAHIESGLFADYCEVVESGEPLSTEEMIFTEDRRVRRLSLALDLRAAKLGDGVVVAGRDVSASKQAEATRARLAAIVESTDDAVISTTLDGQVVSWNGAAERMYGYTAEEALGCQFSSLVTPSREHEVQAILARVLRGEHVDHFEADRWRKDGSVINVAVRDSPILDDSGKVIGASSVARDVSERKRAQAAVWEAEERFRRAFDEAPIGMAMLDLDLRFVQVNEALCEITGYSREQLEATTSEAITHPDDLGEQEREIAAVLAGEAAGYQSEKRFVHAGRNPVWVAVQITLLRDADAHPLRFLAQIQDITDRRHSEERLVYLADHDPLTGSLNRRSFEHALEAHHLRKARYGGRGAVIMLDLDHFKFINDTLGHHAGDEAISRAARVLESRLRETDVLARLDGDEFAVLLPNADSAQARVLAEDLLAALRAEKVELGSHARPLAASAGISMFESAEELSSEDVLVNADLAMCDAKDAGRDRAELYPGDGHGSSRMKGRVTWAQRIGAAIQHGGFVLLAQPIVEFATGRASQYELLLRMRDEHGDLIPPGSFLYIAERLGMVQEIDRWVTEQAITLLAEHHAPGEELTLEVNLSGLSIGDPELLALISRELERTHVSPHSLIFEITETAAVINMPRAAQFIRDINQLGCRFALDDFGAGYGSFYYLKHLPFDFLKIDGEFVKGCRTSETDRLLIKAAVDVATGMGKRTIAEFVGDEETASLLTRLGVNYGQGFHLGRPGAFNGTQPAAILDAQRPDSDGVSACGGERRAVETPGYLSMQTRGS
jgi:diguanylate cyclase (GGDEF)-like protein/PAS domain S-box-containing protein